MLVSSTAVLLLLAVVVSLLVKQTNGTVFIFGGEARRVCEAYKRLCPVKKICALQTIYWPAPMKFPVCVHEKHLVVKSKMCRKAPVHGKCGAKFMRWYFNVHMGACSWFTYSGCGGNRNNFRTSEECEARCMGVETNITDKRYIEDTASLNISIDRSIEDMIIEKERDFTTYEENIHRELKFHPAPEIIEMDKADIRASFLSEDRRLVSNDMKKNKSKVITKEHHKNGKKNKINRKKMKKIKHGDQYSQFQTTVLTKSERSVDSTTIGVFEHKIPMTSYHLEDISRKLPVWKIDTRLSRGQTNSNLKHLTKNRNIHANNHLNLQSKEEKDSYYDNVNMFKILNKK